MRILNILRPVVLPPLLVAACAAEPEVALEVAGAASELRTQNCNQEQIDALASGVNWAGLSLLNASEDLETVRAGGSSERYSTWFGPPSDSRVDRVKTTLEGAYKTIPHASFDCGCNIPLFFQQFLGITPANTVAWTDPESSTFTIQLCPKYFAHVSSQDDFLEVGAGVLVHELTHFWGTIDAPGTCVAPSCNDHPTVALQLDPEQATKNADNYMYYALGWPAGAPSAVTCNELNPQCPLPTD